MIKPFVRAEFRSIGYDPPRKTTRRFTISGITYQADSCNIGETPQGEATPEGTIRMINERELRGLRVLDICCDVGIAVLGSLISTSSISTSYDEHREVIRSLPIRATSNFGCRVASRKYLHAR
jgi:hypothetical protein